MHVARSARTPAPYGLAFALAFGLVAASLLTVPVTMRAASPAANPAQVLTVTVALGKTSYLSGDTASAVAVVYRTPSPGTYTYAWRVVDSLGRLLAERPTGTSSFAYDIPLDFQGGLRFEVTVDDGEGNTAAGARTATVAIAYMALVLDRAEFNPGETITAFYSVSSRVIRKPTYNYTVQDAEGTIVLQGDTSQTTFSYRVPNPSSASYTFRVIAREGANTTQAQLTINRSSGVVLSVTLDRTAYLPGEPLRVHLAVTARGTTALPSQFRWLVSIAGVTATAITTRPEADLVLTIPQGVGPGDVVLVAQETNTGALSLQTVRIGPTNPLWSTEIGGIPLFAVLLGLLVLGLVAAVAALWRRAAGPRGPSPGPGAPPPPGPPEAPKRAPPTLQMSVPCKNCGRTIEITTSKRPIEVMCPACGETQLVA